MATDKILKIISGTRDFFNQFDSAVIGLSGGIDSAFVLNILARSLHKQSKTIYAFYMPTEKGYNEEIDKKNNEYVESLLNQVDDIDIRYSSKILPKFGDLKNLGSELSYGNLCSRMRMALLYFYANEHNGIVVGTTNLTEYKLGYFTKYGDGGVDLEPIINLSKNEVYMYSRMFNVPEFYIDRNPSAELYENQTDEKEIGMTYSEIEFYMEEPYQEETIANFFNFKDLSIINRSHMYENMTQEKKEMISNMILKSEHKRTLPFGI